MVTIIGNDVPELKDLKCPYCGNEEDFSLEQLGSVPQRFRRDPDDGSRDFSSHDNELEDYCVEYQVSCRGCNSLVAHRDVTVAVGPWKINQRIVIPYLVVVASENVRDTQISGTPDADMADDDAWADTQGQHVLGVFQAETVDDALAMAAERCGMSEEVLLAYQLDSPAALHG